MVYRLVSRKGVCPNFEIKKGMKTTENINFPLSHLDFLTFRPNLIGVGIIIHHETRRR
jgi:hypothetical protein